MRDECVMLGRGARHMAKAEVNTFCSAHQASLVLPVCVYQSGLAACEVKPEITGSPAPCISFEFIIFPEDSSAHVRLDFVADVPTR